MAEKSAAASRKEADAAKALLATQKTEVDEAQRKAASAERERDACRSTTGATADSSAGR